METFKITRIIALTDELDQSGKLLSSHSEVLATSSQNDLVAPVRHHLERLNLGVSSARSGGKPKQVIIRAIDKTAAPIFGPEDAYPVNYLFDSATEAAEVLGVAPLTVIQMLYRNRKTGKALEGVKIRGVTLAYADDVLRI